MIASNRTIPSATYRLQFNRQFTFAQAAAIAGYLRDLGISDCYASPLFQAGPQSTHGYDICAFDRINPHLGGAADFDRFTARLKDLGLGLLLDMVPNHMGNDHSNAWWVDVLQKGPGSNHARWFDIDWQPLKPDLRDRVLLPVLEDHYAAVLEAGKLRVVFEAGAFALSYHDKRFPVSEHSSRDLRSGAPNALEDLNGKPGAPHSFDRLDALLRQQHYRLAYWRVGPEEINYRRFFDITDLVSLRIELPEVFRAVHRLLFPLLSQGKVTGLRIDHPDGLWDPKQYFERLQSWRGSLSSAPDSVAQPLYLVAEKILTGDETLPADWPVDGTTGYEFLNRVNRLFVSPDNRDALDELYRQFAPEDYWPVFGDLVRESKRRVLRNALISELNALTHRLERLAARSRYGQDFTFLQIHAALEAVIVAFPVYRTYITEETAEVSARDREHITQALLGAKACDRGSDAALFGFIENLLLLQPPDDLERAAGKECREFVMRFQQLTGPVMAKGLEDTAFYIYNRLISLNEVGGDPDAFGAPVREYHAATANAARWPHSLLATATHDTKRGEDARARIDVLSEMPGEWGEAAGRWALLNAARKGVVDGRPAPSANDEYLLYQTLIGAWPAEAETAGGLKAFGERVAAYMLKAIKEAKTHTSWAKPNSAYEQAVQRFVHGLLSDERRNPFLADFKPFQRRVAFFGRFNSLSQTLLKITSPGVPDFYQGTELWDFSMVDPDNRRPVDYEIRRRLLRELMEHGIDERAGEPAPSVGSPSEAEAVAGGSEPREPMAEFLRRLVRRSEDGRIKLYEIWRALNFRNRHKRLFETGGYFPLYATGPKSGHVCAFARQGGEEVAVTIVPRLVLGLTEGAERPPTGGEVWRETLLPLPDAKPGERYRNVFTGEVLTPSSGLGGRTLRLDEVLSEFPVALLGSF
jgi:(1->4)-alpha-D-glucan 1-alpha-D-glucosylmutase